MFRKLSLLLAGLAFGLTFGLALGVAGPAAAQAKKDSVVLGMALEPPGLDPTAGAAAAIGEIVHYNILEGLTKINADGKVTPLLAESWTISPDLKTYTFKLRQGVKFQNGDPLTSADVKFSFERAAAEKSTNKQKVFFNTFKVDAPDPATAVLTLNDPNPDFLFILGFNTAVIVNAKTADGNATNPIGTGPYKLESWAKGSSATLTKWDGFRDAAKIKINKVTFRFISDAAAQVTALLAGDVDAFPRFGSAQSVPQFQADKRFVVTTGGTEGKTIVAINNTKKPFDDVRVRRAIAHAVDRKAIIDGAMNGFGTPIGSHYVPIDPGYVDLTGMYPHDPGKAKALLQEAGVKTPIDVTLTLPPPNYARRGGEVVAEQLRAVGINAKIENVEWAQWLSGTFKGNFDLTIISHVEPMDLVTAYANPNYYFHYDSQPFRDLMTKIAKTADEEGKLKLLGDAQRMIATDSVNAFLFQLPQINVANAKLKGLWKDAPIFANDVSALAWE
jgi:peptide/nickel transport system substrate-binding protein